MNRGMRIVALLLILMGVTLLAAGCSSQSKPEDFVVEDGVLTAYTGKAKNVVIPDGVTQIGKGVFKETGIKTLVIPDSVKLVGYEAFFGCQKLTSVKLPDNGIVLGERSFNYCYKLTDMVIPDSAEVYSHAITNFNDSHAISPAPEGFSLGGQMTPTGLVSSVITLCNMRFTETGELKLTFIQSAGKKIPITFNADGSISASFRLGFSVQLGMADGKTVSMSRWEIGYDPDQNHYRYMVYFDVPEKPQRIVIQGNKKTIELNGKTYAEFKPWETK